LERYIALEEDEGNVMKIVHISTLFFPFVGGLERAVQRVAEEQAKLGHEVIVVTSDAYAEDRPRVEKGLITVVRVKSWKNPYPYLIVPREIPRDVLEDADIVVGWGHTYYFAYRMVKEAKNLGKTVGMYFIGVDYLQRHYNPLFRLLGFQYQRMLTKRLAEIVDIAFTTNEFEKELLKVRYGLDSFVIPHGVDEIYFRLPNMAKHFRNKYNVDGRIISYIGRVHPTKGVDLLIKAFAKIVKTEPTLKLIIAGKGDEKYLRKCLNIAKRLGIDNKIRYLNYIPEEDKIGLIDASELVVIPSKHAGENYSIVIDEVKARGKPLVVTNYGALPYRIRNVVEGIVVNADANSLAKGITYVLNNIDMFRIVEKPYTWSEVAKKLVDLYIEVTQ
jgi:glycosyltransferase involved in cell wall biosynthesis